MSGPRRTWRRALLFGVPALYVVLGFLHPIENPELGDDTDLFVGLHVAQLFLIMGLAYVLWFLVEGLDSRAATTARSGRAAHSGSAGTSRATTWATFTAWAARNRIGAGKVVAPG